MGTAGAAKLALTASSAAVADTQKRKEAMITKGGRVQAQNAMCGTQAANCVRSRMDGIADSRCKTNKTCSLYTAYCFSDGHHLWMPADSFFD